ncbi:hypothetical protein K490DRAFT_63678 [Saccharata proteae CBS 121410]|uniref:F-box domain-containing protein n=1 Tax=Saccharata proteae CBS 121410 TaxID=1314787 RepID=A0A6A5YCX8_9PEZI|nr:hypothetical protein K490DRAFT_63678 [Saccharata proteae CBS 121410]
MGSLNNLPMRSANVAINSEKTTTAASSSSAATPNSTRLSELPPEILLSIITYLPNARSLSSLSQTCKYLHRVVLDGGWRDFVHTRFPSQLSLHANRGDAARALSTLSRNWDRKTITARYIEPTFPIHSLNTKERFTQWQRPKGQTMGFQPCLDSYVLMHHEDVNRRQEYLAASAGAELLLRKTSIGPVVEQWWERSSDEDRRLYWDHHHHRTAWYTFRFPGAMEGRDDITSLNFVRPGPDGWSQPNRQDIVVGSAQGDLSLLHVRLGETPDGISGVWESFNTNIRKGISVRATDISDSTSPLLAAAFEDRGLKLYPVPSHERSLEEIPERSPTIDSVDHIVLPIDAGCRIWNTQFISPTALAVCIGPSAGPVHVYSTSATGFSKQPIRQFGTNGRHSSVYSLASLPPSSQASNDTGQVFLSGGYDGVVRVHDMRSPRDFVSCYWDPTDDGAVYSMQTLARERLVVGNSRNALIKVYDLRMAGGRAYHYLDLESHLRTLDQTPNTENIFSSDGVPIDGEDNGRNTHNGWNLFLNPRERRNYRASNSPVYALTSPSPHSPSLIAGIENGFVQLDVSSATDVRDADPIHHHCMTHPPPSGRGSTKKEPRGRNGPNRDPAILNLAAYEQTTEAAMRLRVQRDVGHARDAKGGRGHGRAPGVPGWDQRWIDSRDE